MLKFPFSWEEFKEILFVFQNKKIALKEGNFI